MHVRLVFFLSLVFFLFSCSKDKPEYTPTIKSDPYETYKEGLRAFNKNDFFFASKKFSEAELSFGSPSAAAKSAIMSSFSLYAINFYNEAEESLNRYLNVYPADKHLMYAHYLLAIIAYEQIGEERHDLQPLIDAKKRINKFLEKYPNSEYAIDLRLKNDLVQNQFAARELYIAKYYIKVQKWVPAINRLKIIVKDYNTTVFIEEALHRLVEIHYHIGLEDEAKKFAALLGYNFNSSEWFKQSYKILNKDYNFVKKDRVKNDKTLFKKIIDKIK